RRSRSSSLAPGRYRALHRRLGVVLDIAAYLTGALDRLEPGDEVERHVDSGRHPGGRDDLAAVDEPVVGPHLDRGLELGERLEAAPPGRRPPGAQPDSGGG